MKPPTRAVPYAFIYPILAKLARDKGYSLALHGSMQEDLDIVAIPWTPEACSAQELMEYMARQVWIFHYTEDTVEWEDDAKWIVTEPEQKPHGRVAWSIQLKNGCRLDLSVMPRA
jgi:hypothetical protein